MKRIDVDQAQRLIGRGALVVDVLPAPTYVDEHLPGAVNIPLTTFDDEALSDIERDRALVVYCFDQRCDLSARASARLDQMGFTGVHDLIGGRAAWTVLGLPTEGQIADRHKISRHVRPVASVSVTGTISDVTASDVRAEEASVGPIAVLDDAGVLLGSLDEAALQLPGDTPVERAMTPAPGTVRPDMRLDAALRQLADDGLASTFVTTARGELVGLLLRDEHV
jgi:rhodanese-related sulfurtransferase